MSLVQTMRKTEGRSAHRAQPWPAIPSRRGDRAPGDNPVVIPSASPRLGPLAAGRSRALGEQKGRSSAGGAAGSGPCPRTSAVRRPGLRARTRAGGETQRSQSRLERSSVQAAIGAAVTGGKRVRGAGGPSPSRGAMAAQRGAESGSRGGESQSRRPSVRGGPRRAGLQRDRGGGPRSPWLGWMAVGLVVTE